VLGLWKRHNKELWFGKSLSNFRRSLLERYWRDIRLWALLRFGSVCSRSLYAS